MANKPVKHHFVPVAYLRAFCCPDGNLHHCVMRVKDGTTVPPVWVTGTPETVGYERNLYNSPADTPETCHVEAELATIESSAMPVIRRVLAERPGCVGFDTMPEIPIYIATMAMRTPNALKIKASLESLVKSELVRRGLPNKPRPEEIIGSTHAIQQHVEKICWYLYWFDGTDGRTLVTSDRPVGIYALREVDRWTGKELQPSPLEAGILDSWAKSGIFTFALSSRCALLGFKGSRAELEQTLSEQVGVECDARLPGWVNAMSAFLANHVYTADRVAKFLLPNPPGGPHDLEFVPSPSSGILVPLPRNRLGIIEEFAPLADAFVKGTGIPFPK